MRESSELRHCRDIPKVNAVYPRVLITRGYTKDILQVVGLSRIEDYDGPISKDIPPGAVGIGLYDLSDITLLFDNKEHALNFAGDIADDLDPIDWLLWDDDRWIAWEV